MGQLYFPSPREALKGEHIIPGKRVSIICIYVSHPSLSYGYMYQSIICVSISLSTIYLSSHLSFIYLQLTFSSYPVSLKLLEIWI